jgi:hypothetical protein
MPILQGDIQLRASRVMDDVPEGGGGPSNVVIESGQENAIMPDISRWIAPLAATTCVRCMWAWTPKTATPTRAAMSSWQSPRRSQCLHHPVCHGRVYDTRAQAQARLEAYLNKGAEWAGYLYENHIKGQRVIQIFQRPGTELPAVGKTLVLVGNEGLAMSRSSMSAPFA